MPGGRPRKQAAPVSTRRKRGTGSLTVNHKTGRVYAQDIRDEHGRRETYDGAGLTIESRIGDATAWLDNRVAARARAAGILPQTVGDYLAQWHHDTYRASPFTTSATVRTNLNRVEPLYALELMALSRADVDRLTADLQAERLAPRYVKQIRSTLRAAMSAAVAAGYIDANPVGKPVTPIRVPQRQQVVWESDAVKLFLRTARLTDRWPLWLVALSYGLRQGELRALQWSDLDLRRRVMTVRRGMRRGRREADTKTHNERQIKLLPEIVDELRAFRSSPFTTSTYVFSLRPPAAMTPENLASELKRLITRVNDENPPADSDPPRLAHLTLHGLRHTFSTLMLRRGVPVAKLSQILGHSKPSITWDMYGWVLGSDDEKVDEAIRGNLF